MRVLKSALPASLSIFISDSQPYLRMGATAQGRRCVGEGRGGECVKGGVSCKFEAL